MRRVLVCGGRDFANWELFKRELNRILPDGPVTFISGMARGADTFAVKYAQYLGDEVLKFPADWEKYGRGAGHIRNQQMLDEGKPDLVIAFPGGRGTANMIERAKKAGVEVVEIQV